MKKKNDPHPVHCVLRDHSKDAHKASMLAEKSIKVANAIFQKWEEPIAKKLKIF